MLRISGIALLLALAGNGLALAQGEAASRIDVSAFEDNCTGEPGYGAFRTEFERVVLARDGKGLRALFAPDGAMRVNGVGGRGNTPDWGLDRPQAAGVWSELDEILKLGCERSGERLVLPGMAKYTELEPGQAIVLRDETMRLAPQANAKALRQVTRGQVFPVISWGNAGGWVEVSFGDRVGYLPTDSLRTTGATRLELVRFGDGWRIGEFGSGV